MARLMKVLFVLGSSAFLLQLGGCFAKSDGGMSVFPIAYLSGLFRLPVLPVAT